jgi:hypothetical protein
LRIIARSPSSPLTATTLARETLTHPVVSSGSSVGGEHSNQAGHDSTKAT